MFQNTDFGFICKGFSVESQHCVMVELENEIGVHSKVMVDLRGRVSMS